MADEFQAQLAASIGWRWTSGSVIDDGQLAVQIPFAHGNEAGQAEAVWSDLEAVLVAGAPRLLDLTSLQRSLFGDTLLSGFATVKGLLLVHHGASGSISVGAAGDNEWSAPFAENGQSIVVPPQSALLVGNRQDGWAVDSTHRMLRLAASDGEISYSMVVFGTLAAS